VVLGRIRAVDLSFDSMTPEQEKALEEHLQAIAQILYEESDPNALKTLEGIEMTVRQKIQSHVSPKLGNFLSESLQEPKPVKPER
jgi:hypothetical protein